jgi:hypothetical protein
VSRNLTFYQRLLLGWGKVRRFYLYTVRRDYVERQLAHRVGECTRCGACCKLMFTCPILDPEKIPATCARHKYRFRNCRYFPIDHRDLRDRDIVMPAQKCGFSFNGVHKRQ